MHVVADTDRLLLRRFTGADVDALVALDADPEVMRFLTGGQGTPAEVVEQARLPRFLQDYVRWEAFGFFAAVERASGTFLGWFEFRPREDEHADPDRAGPPYEVELGYRLRREAWGHGYATEGARRLVHGAFTRRDVARVVAETMAVNLASRRVMEKVGLRHVRTFHPQFDDPLPGTEHGEVEYALTRAEWEDLRARAVRVVPQRATQTSPPATRTGTGSSSAPTKRPASSN